MSKIISLFQIKTGFISNLLAQDPKNKEEYAAFASRAIKEIEAMTEKSCGCTCDMCYAWTKYEGEKEKFTADGGYLGFCKVHQFNTIEGDFCSESWIKECIENS